MKLFDTHAHLDLSQFKNDLRDVLSRSQEEGIQAVVSPGITADSSRQVVQIAHAHDMVYAAVGIQPNSCAEAKDVDWDTIVDLAGAPKVVALGETGLDRYWDYTPMPMQQDYFVRHLELGAERELPIIIHCREAEDDLLPTLRSFTQAKPLKGLIHSFSGDRAFAEACLEFGLYISFAGGVTYRNKKFAPLWEAATIVPDDRLLVETDSPFLTPHPLRGKKKRNEPGLVKLVVERLAELRGQDAEHVAQVTTENANRVFGLGHSSSPLPLGEG